MTGNVGKFRVPTLRNIAFTAEEVLDHYSAGGRTIPDGPYAGRGSDNPNKSFFVQGFEATPEERRDLIEFLKSLTDVHLLTNPDLSNPLN